MQICMFHIPYYTCTHCIGDLRYDLWIHPAHYFVTLYNIDNLDPVLYHVHFEFGEGVGKTGK
jgi:hypothetical protein